MAKKGGSKSKKDTKKKNKGPKGKKARAKAKLDRQWGEEAVDTGRAFKKGRYSRLLNKNDRVRAEPEKAQVMVEAEQEENPMTMNEKPSNDTDNDSDSDQDETTPMDLSGGAYARLLDTIRKNDNKKSRDDYGSDNDLEEDEEEEDMQQQQEILSDSSSDDDEFVDAVEHTMADDDNKVPSFDPFGDRFTQHAEPIPEKELDSFLRTRQETQKVAVPHVDPMLELQISKLLLENMECNLDDKSDSKNNTTSMTKENWKKLANASFDCNRQILKEHWQTNNKSQKRLSSLQRVLYPFLTRYADCLVSAAGRSQNQKVSQLAALHIANHVLTSRGRIQRNNRKIKLLEQEQEEAEEKEEDPATTKDDNNKDDNDETEIKDQGYTRPTVLVLLPTRGTCYKFVQQLIQLVGGDGTVPQDYLDRFEREYGAIPTGEDDDDDAMKKRRKKVLEEKGAAWRELFGDDVNDDDDFKLGIALNAKATHKKDKNKDDANTNNKVHVKLYTDFYGSDIIVGSPLGLKMAMGNDESEGNADFLSSIEICMLDRSDVLMMQNWDHVNAVLDRINRLPQNDNDTDFSRVRSYFLESQASYWRQLIVLTDVVDPTINSAFKRFAKSKNGVLKTRRRVLEDEASIAKIIVPVQQVFQRVPVQTVATMSDDRMKYLTQKILPSILQNRQKHTLLYIPSYFDFVLVRNHLIKKEFHDYVTINEYSRVSETSRGRARFLQGRKPLMLYTGRAHFFLRHKIKGIRNLIFFGLPEHAEFYVDLVNVIQEGLEHSNSSAEQDDSTSGCIALFTRYEGHALERIVGTQQSNRMIKGEKPTFLFVS